VELRADWEGDFPNTDSPVVVESRLGCDLDPVDLADDGDVLRLQSYVWGTQRERFERLRTAIACARGAGIPVVERGSAAGWASAQIEGPREDVALVVFHSAVWSYLPDDEKEKLRTSIEENGRLADGSSPLAWLRLENRADRKLIELRLALWPWGTDELLATIHPRRLSVRWVR